MATKPATAPQPGTSPQSADGQQKTSKRKEKTPEQLAARKAENRKRFLTYAAKRTESALRALRNVKRLANKASYDYTSDEVDKICSAIVTASMDIRKAFDGQKEKANVFTL